MTRLKMQSEKDQYEQIYGKIQPQAPELEEAVLGALMVDVTSLSHVVDLLKPEVFYVLAHQIIYRAILNLYSASHPIDMLTVTEEVRRMGKIEVIGGPYFIVELTNRVASAANIEYHSRIIYQKFIQREIGKIGSEMTRDSYRDEKDVFVMLADAEKRLFDLSNGNTSADAQSLSEIGRDVLLQAERAMKARESGSISGVTTGLRNMDLQTGGLKGGHLIILAGRPSMGKSALAISTVGYSAAKDGVPVGVFSLEMTKTELTARIIAQDSQVTAMSMNNGELHDSDLLRIQEAMIGMNSVPMYIDDTPGISINTLRAKARRMKMKYGIGLLIVDYLQLMVSEKAGNREQEVSSISRGLKLVAKELDIPVIALAQLSRAVEQRGGSKRPQLSDLRESGSLEQDADIVIFMYRPEYYGILEDKQGVPTVGIAEGIIAKNRHGPLVTVMMRFQSKFAMFSDLETSTQFPGRVPVVPNEPDKPDDEDLPF